MRLSRTSPILLLLLLGLSACRPPSSESVPSLPSKPEPKLSRFLGRTLGDAKAPVRVISVLPVNNGCQDVIGEYLAQVAEQFPAIYQVRIMDMKSTEGKDTMRSHHIGCATVIVNGKTTFDLGGEGGTFMLEGPMDPRDVARALEAAALQAGATKPNLPAPPPLPGIEKMAKRTPQ